IAGLFDEEAGIFRPIYRNRSRTVLSPTGSYKVFSHHLFFQQEIHVRLIVFHHLPRFFPEPSEARGGSPIFWYFLST
ncbi:MULTISPECIES: hypothetical protein, partial [unclassified Endozoicomonas]|uniref:hypothetical protein n=1 Tax=unclassified Endozoicomonas TaxID=2644528 RepID=UPI003BB6A7EE